MRVEPSAILRYKIHTWITKRGKLFWGIDVVIDGRAYHVKEDKEELFFETKSEAIKHVRRLNKDLRENRK